MWFAYLRYRSFHNESVWAFQLPQNVRKHLTTFLTIEMAGDSFLKHVPTRWWSLLPAIEDVIMSACHKIIFSKRGTRRMSCSNLEIYWGWERREELQWNRNKHAGSPKLSDNPWRGHKKSRQGWTIWISIIQCYMQVVTKTSNRKKRTNFWK